MFSLKAHNSIDYVYGALLLITPWLVGFSDIPEARLLFLASGVTLIAYSSITEYEISFARMIPLGAHMTLDAILGMILILAPALFGYREEITRGQFVAHIVVGIFALGLVALTRPAHAEAEIGLRTQRRPFKSEIEERNQRESRRLHKPQRSL